MSLRRSVDCSVAIPPARRCSASSIVSLLLGDPARVRSSRIVQSASAIDIHLPQRMPDSQRWQRGAGACRSVPTSVFVSCVADITPVISLCVNGSLFAKR